ncbi:MAG: carbohydrate kinase family protein [Chloroflexota bacterium]
MSEQPEISTRIETGPHLAAVAAGYPSLDSIYHVSHLAAPGTTGIIQDRSDTRHWGGCAFNIAVGVARMGLPSGIIGTLGDDEDGRGYVRWLQENRVDSTAITIQPGGTTPTSNLYYDPTGTSICYYWPGAAGQQGDAGAQSALLARTDWLVLAVAPAGLTTRLLDMAEQQNAGRAVHIAWSVKADAHSHPRKLVERLLSASRLVFLNRDELRFIGEATGRSSVEEILAAGPEMVVLTLGAQGSVVATRSETVEVQAAPVKRVVDTTGSGDAYVSGFLAALIRGATPKEAAMVGARNAAAVLEQVGSQAGLCTSEEQIWRQTQL